MTEAATLYKVEERGKKGIHDTQQTMLAKLMKRDVRIKLTNGTGISGVVTGHDKFTIVINNQQLIYKHSIATISPTGETTSRWHEHMKSGI